MLHSKIPFHATFQICTCDELTASLLHDNYEETIQEKHSTESDFRYQKCTITKA